LICHCSFQKSQVKISKSQSEVIVVDDEETQSPEIISKPKSIPTNTTKIPNKFKYDGPIRKKEERALLKGRDCPHCKKFYDAVNDGADHKFDFLQCSRHREIHTPHNTPEQFWQVGFPDSEDTNLQSSKSNTDAMRSVVGDPDDAETER